MVMALSACPVTITEILGNVEKISSGEMEIDQFVDGLVDPNAEDIPMAPDEPDELEMMDEGEEGDDEEGGGGEGPSVNKPGEGVGFVIDVYPSASKLVKLAQTQNESEPFYLRRPDAVPTAERS